MKDKKLLSEFSPELSKEWHPIKNGDKTPYNTGVGERYEAWWIFPYDDLETGKHFDFEWRARVDNRYYQRLKGKGGCPFLSNEMIWPGYNDLQTKNPQIAKEWDYEKNGGITPDMVAPTTSDKYWWIIDYKKTDGTVVKLSWDASPSERSRGEGCPYISNPMKRILVGFNDLESQYPELAKQWSPKNIKKPSEVFKGCNKDFIWHIEHYDERTGKLFDFEWTAQVNQRNDDGSDCPYLSNKKSWPGFNDLESNFPEIAKEFDVEKNGVTPDEIVFSSKKKLFWKKDAYDSRTGQIIKDYTWKQSPYDRTVMGKNCPLEGNNQFSLIEGLNDLKTLYGELAKEWNYKRNGDFLPNRVLPGSPKKVWWIIKVTDEYGTLFDFEWKATINRRVNGTKSPFKDFSELAKRVYFILKRFNYEVFVEHSIEGLKEDKPLLFDFYLPEKNVAIEVDGTQHFSQKFMQSEKDFKRYVSNDNKKNDYCRENGIRLLRIPYDVKSYDNLALIEIISNFIDNNKLDVRISEKYRLFEESNYIMNLEKYIQLKFI